MARYAYRELRPTAEGEEVFRRWLAHLDEEFTRHKEPRLRGEIVRDALHQIYLGRPHGGKLNTTLISELPGNVLQLTLDPANVTLEPEYYGDVDAEKYAERKPLIWFWQMFDRSALGLNHWLGFRFRKMLAKHIFKHVGKNVKIFHGVEFSFGYNLTVEDDCTIHKFVMLDDRGELIIRKGTSISDYAAVYSHWHQATDYLDVENRTTEIGPGTRLTYHSAVMCHRMRSGEASRPRRSREKHPRRTVTPKRVSTLYQQTNLRKAPPYDLSSRPKRTRISCIAKLTGSTYAAFFKESRRNFANANNLNRKSGGAKWRALRCAFPSSKSEESFRPDGAIEVGDTPA
jgi:acetyltransferase-like isoleucine patch superfamily enzyme